MRVSSARLFLAAFVTAPWVAHAHAPLTTTVQFDREVVRALSQWRFNPEPVGFIGEYEISFRLTDD